MCSQKKKKENVKLEQEEIEHEHTGNIKDAEIALKDLTSPFNPAPDGSTDEFYPTFKKQLISILHKLFQNNCSRKQKKK